MAYKGETYKQVPTLWHVGWGYPCRVMRRRHVVNTKTGKRVWRWQNYEHDVLTLATAMRWKQLEKQGKAIIRRDVNVEMFYQAGIIAPPKRAMWAGK